MAVEAVFADVELAAEEPGVVTIPEIDVLDLIEVALPEQELPRHAAPETIRITYALIVEGLVFGHSCDVRTLPAAFDDRIGFLEGYG